jgi:HTH-type transcriptional regulator/antitoxin HigA
MLKPIKSDVEYQNYLSLVYDLMQKELKPDSRDSDHLEVLSILIQTYEKEHFPIEHPNPIDAILFRLDQMGLKKSDLTKILGSRSRVSEVLNGKRKLSLDMIRKLNTHLGISADILIKNYGNFSSTNQNVF